jgi:hypothetical protein
LNEQEATERTEIRISGWSASSSFSQGYLAVPIRIQSFQTLPQFGASFLFGKSLITVLVQLLKLRQLEGLLTIG